MLQETEVLPVDNLFSAEHQVLPAVAGTLTIMNGTGLLKRGTLLGESNIKTTTVFYREDHWDVSIGQILGVATITDSGTMLVEGTDYSVSFNLSRGQYEIVALAGGTIASYTDSLVVYTTAEKGSYQNVGVCNAYYFTRPLAILARDVDATSQEVEAPVYFTGEFNKAAIIAPGVNLDEMENELNSRGIFLR